MEDNDRQSSESIRNLMEDIDNNNITLPEFQRDFVWDITKTYDLFDSIVKDIFIGSIIYGIPSFEVTVREIDNRDRKTSGKRRKKLKLISYTKEEITMKVNTQRGFRLVLDGQQRVTSIFRAVKGIDTIWFVCKNEDEVDEDMKNKEINQMTLEEVLYEFNGQEDENRLSIKLSDVYSIMENSYFEDEIKENFFSKIKFIENVSEEEQNLYFRRYLIFSRKIQDLFKAQKLISYYLLNMNSEKFALFFERSNSKGVRLNFIDILAAKLYKGFNFRNEMEKVIDLHGNKYNFEREIIVRTISYIVSNGKNVDRGFILKNLNHEDFNLYWNEVCDSYKKVLDFLFDNHFIISQSWMPYDNIVIPLMVFFRELPHKDFTQMNEKQKEFIHYWYWASIFSQRYGGASNDVIIQDSNILKIIAKNQKITDKTYFSKLRIQVNAFEDLYLFSKSGSSIYRGILNLINYNTRGLKDFKSTNQITFNSKLEDHHIFPKEYIKTQIKENEEYIEMIDCVLNRTLIPKIVNIQIGRKSPSRYLNDLKRDNPNIIESLKTHLIPVDIIEGLYDEFYLDFLEERAKLIFSIIKKHITDKSDEIIEEFYEQVKRKSTTIKVFGRYRNKIVEATFNIETQEILYDGIKYSSVVASSDKAKSFLTGNKNVSTNGWKFWKYTNEYGEERSISDYRY